MDALRHASDDTLSTDLLDCTRLRLPRPKVSFQQLNVLLCLYRSAYLRARCRALFCCKDDDEFETEGGKQVLRREYQKLGKVKYVH